MENNSIVVTEQNRFLVPAVVAAEVHSFQRNKLSSVLKIDERAVNSNLFSGTFSPFS